MVGLTSRPSYGHLLWKMRVLLRREDVFQHPIARRLPAWQQPYLEVTWNAAQWHPSRGSRKPWKEGRRACRGNAMCRHHHGLWVGRSCPGQWQCCQSFPLVRWAKCACCCCCVQDVRWTHRSLCAFCPFFTSWEKFAGIGHHSTGSMGPITVSSCSYKGDFGFSVSFPDSTESEFEWILAVIFYSFAFWLHFSCACFSTLVPCFAQA